MDENSIHFGKRVREYRLSHDMTQEELSEKIDISSNYMSHIERGKTMPSMEIVLRIAEELNVSLDLLFQDCLSISVDVSDKEIEVLIQKMNEKERDLAKLLLQAVLNSRE